MQIPKKNFSEKLLAVVSDIKTSKWPLFLSYRPHSFALKGNHTREIMKAAKPGDILVRSFNNYLNNSFLPGTFTHVGFYLGEVNEIHLKQIAKIEHLTQFNIGKQMVIHAINDQVFLDDIIDFCRCDGLALMRFPRQLKSLGHYTIPETLPAYFTHPFQPTEEATETDTPAETASTKDSQDQPEEEAAQESVKPDAALLALVKAEKEIAQYLSQGKVIEFEKIFKILYRVALRELGTPHDYEFEIDKSIAGTELVYFITKSICWNYGIEPQLARVFFKKRQVILPDAFVDGELEEVWKMVN